MLATITYFSASVAAFAAAFLLHRSAFVSHDSQRMTTPALLFLIINAVLFLTGATLIFVETERLREVDRIGSWQKVDGKVLETAIVGRRGFNPRVNYEYTVGGTRYTGTDDLYTPAFGTGRHSRRETADGIAANYNPNTKVTVYCNPENPAESRLETGAGWDIYIRYSVGIFVYLFGLTALLVMGRRYRFSFATSLTPHAPH